MTQISMRVPPVAAPLDLATQPLSTREIVFPEIGMMHAASSLASGEDARVWRDSAYEPEPPSPSSTAISLRPVDPEQLPADPIDAVIMRRRSNRHYVTDVHATILNRLGLDSRRLEIPGRKRLDIDHGTAIEAVLA